MDKPLKRKPKQERSRQIVDSILEGATRVLSSLRLREVSTNRIAQVAGVGIGSLYDYFPNKTSIVEALIDKRIEKVFEDFRGLIEQDPQEGIEAKIQKVTRFIRDDFFARQGFLREIFLLAPQTNRMEAMYLLRIAAVDVLAQYLVGKGWAKNPAKGKAFLLIHGVMGIVESHIILEQKSFEPDELAHELENLMRFHLHK